MEAINPLVQKLVLENQLSPRKIRNLILLKKMVDRLCSSLYLDPEEALKIEEKVGEFPDIVTWGDYFQTEIAIEHGKKNDAEFEAVIQTVTFDLIASTLIFTNKDDDFRSNVRNAQLAAQVKDYTSWTSEDEESIHLGILLDYFLQMGLDMQKLTEQDFAYFEQFAAQKAVS